MKSVLTIAGSDCSGGAGIQADIKTMSVHGVYAMSVIVSVVAENTVRVIDVENISTVMVEKQIESVFEDIIPDAIKIGMLPTPACMSTVAAKLAVYQAKNVVIDPVMYAKNGCPLMEPAAVETLIETILPLADLLTPNIPEAERITGKPIRTQEDMKRACSEIAAMGCKAVLVKGGHYMGDAADILYDGENFTVFTAKRIDSKSTHGTGCTLSSAIAANLATGYNCKTAVEKAKIYVTHTIEHAFPLGNGCGPVNHFFCIPHVHTEKA